MNVGLLNTRIVIQKNGVEIDAIGNHKNGWNEYFSCAATVGSESGSEVDAAGQTIDKANIAFTVRWCKETAAVTTTGYRILWNDEIYDISYIDHMNNRRKCLKIWCQKVRR